MPTDDLVEALLDALPVSLYVVDRELRVVAWNSLREQGPMGESRREALGRPLREILSPEGFRAVEATINSVFETGAPNEETREAAHGRVFHVHRRPVLEGGEVTHVLSWFEDVTDRLRAEHALRESDERYRSLVDSSPDAILIHNEETILFANPAAARLLGAPSPDDIVGRPIMGIVPDESWPAMAQRLRDMVHERSAAPIEEQDLVRFDGSLVSVEIAATVFDYGRRPAIQVVLRDVTNRKLLEEQLRQSQKMESIGLLAGGVAHDFNNILGVIMGQVSMLLRRLDPRDEARGRVAEIGKAADRAATVTRQLLAFSRKQILQPRVLDLNAVLRETETILRRLIGEDIEIVTSLEPQLGPVRADPGQLTQVILNLAANARDAMPMGGKLVLETRNVELDESYVAAHVDATPGAHVVLAVSDTGRGMDAATAQRVFEPFFTTKALGKGTGLGLATAYGIVKQSGGHIAVYSEPGHGSTFKLYFPRVAEPVDTEKRPAASEIPSRGTETILLLEDDGALREVIRETLQQAGYTVVDGPTAEAALRAGESHSGAIDLLLTDVVMPQMNGREAAKRLIARRPRARVLYMSGYTDDVIVHHGVLDPGTAFIEKPFTTQALLQKVREELETAKG
jgi:two-component system, cell cycle sensor histidine kinase and response regulator CckA